MQILLRRRTRQMTNINEKNRRIKRSYLAIDINIQFEETCEKLSEKFKVKIKEEFTNKQNKCDKRMKQLEPDKAMLQKSFLEVRKQNITNQSQTEELELYRRRQCLNFF